MALPTYLHEIIMGALITIAVTASGHSTGSKVEL
jgi:hypothetical protein